MNKFRLKRVQRVGWGVSQGVNSHCSCVPHMVCTQRTKKYTKKEKGKGMSGISLRFISDFFQKRRTLAENRYRDRGRVFGVCCSPMPHLKDDVYKNTSLLHNCADMRDAYVPTLHFRTVRYTVPVTLHSPGQARGVQMMKVMSDMKSGNNFF